MQDDKQWSSIRESVDALCGQIFTTASEVLNTVKQVGFSQLLLQPSPNAEDKIVQIKVYDSIFTALITFFEQQDKYELASQLMNAKQQVLRLEMLINAVKLKNMADAQKLVKELSEQRFI